ncbi:short-chain dehydrogenase TIC 32, chloroplastic-like [Solanum tuberosum]|uniref:short-chain dehydrogenase TIC 32, chloroplastic-like n=1 Tax=Solanum tuberosum TaxID=4113 RepID=UPI0003D24D34|nr:PREDICTED: short-chain dehydrogenase TIC 32, chloroplastic-like [Solanum tuberosum]
MWIFGRKGTSGFSCCSTAEEVTQGINGFGLTAIVTGATSGIGMETTRVLALHGVHVIMAVRNMENGKKIKENIHKSIPNAKIDFMELNLSSMESIRKFAKEYNSAGHPLNLLINNAGVMIPPFTLSQDKVELQFAVNHLGHFLLTNLLLENMKNTAKNSKNEGRIVNVASAAHDFAYSQGIIFDKINDKESYHRFHAYGQSKLANILHANELAKRLKEEGVNITANSVHPGPIATNIMRYDNILHGIVNWIGRYVLKNIEQGASTTCYVALHPQVKGLSGEYFSDNNIATNTTTSLAKDSDLAKKLWEFSLDLTK